ncbi:hypothetical protein COCON_G00135530 [Conger conger]|uniref:Uncharacterized protein n=1 Tax=Conger conger TaxID=82655 RepID=A0A9Q1DET0_CONCO|nr:hypothetical protein COCON_G00135530 [Conger conger]
MSVSPKEYKSGPSIIKKYKFSRTNQQLISLTNIHCLGKDCVFQMWIWWPQQEHQAAEVHIYPQCLTRSTLQDTLNTYHRNKMTNEMTAQLMLIRKASSAPFKWWWCLMVGLTVEVSPHRDTSPSVTGLKGVLADPTMQLNQRLSPGDDVASHVTSAGTQVIDLLGREHVGP